MKTMRRALTILLCIIMTLVCTFSVCAESVKYNIRELSMTMEIPDTMSVSTRENSDTLKDNIYLEAVSADSSLTITVSMIQNEKTQEIWSFCNLPADTLEEYKEQMLSNDVYIECTKGNYGDVPFLDFSQKYTTEQGVDIYGKQSVTLVNGMNISITSQSPSDSFTSEELSLIKGCLESIRFSNLRTTAEGPSFWKVLLWIFFILLLLCAAFLVFSYFMGKHSAERRRAISEEKRRRADYDVLSRAEESKPKQSSDSPVGGYKSSSDYFESGFDAHTPEAPATSSDEPKPSVPTVAEKAVKNTSKAFTHMSYFFRNLRREISTGKQKKATKKGKKSSAKKRRPSRDYDVFSDK